MKFGKHFVSESNERWRHFYVNYKLLKKTLKLKVVTVAEGDVDRNASTNERSRTGEISKLFNYLLREEMKTCSNFLIDKIEELKATLQHKNAFVEERFANAYLEIFELQKFAFLNYVAVTKAVKKRNKRLRKAIGEGEVPHLDTLEILKSQSFFTSSSLGHLVRRAESHLSLEGSSDSVENTDRKKKPRCPICLDEIQNGVVLGCGHRFCSDCIARMVAHDAEDAVLVHENELELRCCPVCQKPQILALGCEEVRRKIAEIWDSKKVTGGLSHHCNEEEGVEEDEEDEGCVVKPLTVILDLDQTMIYSSKTWRVSKDSSMETWTIRMAHVPFPVNIYLRPGLREFLKSMASKDLEMIVWTAGIYDYACPIIDQIEEYADVTFSKRFYRNSTTKTALHTTVKDLANLGTDLDRTVLVDDNPLSFYLQPFNGIPITPFLGIYNTIPGNSTNYLMHMLLSVIEELAEKEDVRPYLKEKFNMHGWFAINNIDILDSF